MHPYLLFKFSVIKEISVVYLVFDLKFIALGHILPCSNLQLDWDEMVILMECKPEVGVPAGSLAPDPISWFSSWVSHGRLAVKECSWIYFHWHSFFFSLFIKEILWSVVWNFMNQSPYLNSEYGKDRMWATYIFSHYSSGYIAGRRCLFLCLIFKINHQIIYSPIY